MQQTRVHSPGALARSVRLFGLAVGVGFIVTLGACSSSKPKPAPLESFEPIRTVSVVWSQGLGTVEGAAGLTFVGDSVIAASAGGDVVALSLQNGSRQWELDVRSRLSTAAGSDGCFTAVVTSSNELVVFEKGKEIWRERQPGRVASAPFVAGERVFIQAVDRTVRAYDAVDGRWLWNYQRAGGESLALAVPGVVTSFRDTLLVGQGARLIALDPTKGSPRFEANLGTPRGSNEVERLADLVGPLAQVEGDVCVRAFQLAVGCVNASTGAVRWTRPQAGARAIAANADVVVGADSADRVSAWKASSGDILWRVDRFTHRSLSGMTIWGDLVVAADADGYLHLLALDDGRTVGRFSLDAPLESAPTVKNGLLFAQTRRGTVYALRTN